MCLLQDPHNSVHGICGYPMSVVSYAAFHPIFWLHHCNIDRFFEAHLKVNKEAKEEFEAHEWSNFIKGINDQNASLKRQGKPLLAVPTKTDAPSSRKKTLFEQPLQPFKHRFTGKVRAWLDLLVPRIALQVTNSLLRKMGLKLKTLSLKSVEVANGGPNSVCLVVH
jgi:hypothetical protein